MGGHLEPDHWVKTCRMLVRFNDQAALLVSVIITDQHKYEVIKHGGPAFKAFEHQYGTCSSLRGY
jgi:hypothetical protein